MAATQLDVVNQLATLLGGTRTTGTANTGALESVLAQMQQQNTPEGQAAQLQALFQQAAGQIPGFQNAFANAMGARRTGNSGVQAALSKLLSQTAIAAQANQQKGLADQAQAAGALASATRGTQTKTNLGGAAKNLLLLQGLAKGKKLLDEEGGLGSMMEGIGSMFSGAAPTASTGFSDISSDNMSLAPIFQSNGLDFNNVPDLSFDLGGALGDALDFGGSGLGDTLASGDAAGADFGGGGLLDELWEFGVFADGGLVGRDGKLPAYADGGSVNLLAPGARRGTARSITPTAPTRMSAANMAPSSAGATPSVAGPASAAVQGNATQDGGGVPDLDRDYQPNALAEGIMSAANNPVVRTLLAALNPGVAMVAGMIPGSADESREKTAMRFAMPVVNTLAADMGMTPVAKLLLQAAMSQRDTGSMTAADIGGMSTAPDGMQGISLGDVLGTGGYSTAPQDTSSLTGGDTGGDSGYGASGGSVGDSSRGFSTGGFGEGQYADGGKIKGPGTGTSDSIPAMLSNGEYVISKDVVDAIGVDFFDALQASLHTPAAAQRK